MKNLLLAFFLFSSLVGFAQIVNIPDANFKQALIDKGVDTNNDGEVQQNEAEAVTEIIVSSKGISDLTGIEAFTNLTKLYCYRNNLSSLNVSALTNLENFSCYSNKLTSLDVSALTNLKTFYCEHNQLNSLDVSALTNLEILDCAENSLTSLDVSTLTNLEKLDCSENNLSSLDVSALTELRTFYCDENPQLFDICIAPGQTIRSVIKDAHTILNENCAGRITATTSSEVPQKTPLRAFDVMGNEQPLDMKNTPLIIEYTDGSRAKVFIVE